MLESTGLTVKSLEMIYYRGHPSSMPALFRCEGSKIEKKSDDGQVHGLWMCQWPRYVLPPIIFGGKNDLIQL